MPRYPFFSSCVNWPRGRVDLLHYLKDHSREISRSTFLKNVRQEDLRDLEEECGYAKHPAQGLTMAADWHVCYYRCRFARDWVYWFTWSGIEYVFAQRETMRHRPPSD